MKRIQRKRTKGWRMPEGAVYVGRPTLFGNPWTLRDAAGYGIAEPDRRAWCVAKYERELDHLGLLSDWEVSDERWEAMSRRIADWDSFAPPPSIRPLFRELLRDATALVCWCPLEDENGNRVPCHADVLIELLEATA